MGETENEALPAAEEIATAEPVADDDAAAAEVTDDVSDTAEVTDDDADTAAETDDVAEAVAQADDRAVEESTLDDIAPATTHVATPPAASSAEQADPNAVRTVPLWPFLVYFALWCVLVGVAVWQLLAVPEGQVVYESHSYGLTTLGGMLMTAIGPLLALIVWFVAWWGAEARQRAGLFSAALMRGALATFGGVVLWWIALIVVDTLRLGRPF